MAVKKVPTKEGRWRWRARRHYVCPETGKEKQKTKFCRTKADAIEAERELDDEILELQQRFAVHGRIRVPTLGELWDEAIADARKLGRDRSTISNKTNAKKRVSAAVLDTKMDDLTNWILDKERARLISTCRSWATARITVDEMRALLRLAQRWGILTVVPDLKRITAKELGITEDDEAASLEAAEAVALLEALARQTRPLHHVVAAVQLFAGVRVGMALGLHESEIDLEKGVITFGHQWNDDEQAIGPPKTRKTHRLHLTPALATILSTYPRECPDQELVFAVRETGRPIRRISYNTTLKKAAKQAGIENPDRVTSHVLRHTAGTLVGLATGSELAVMHFLAHSDPKVSRGYIHGKRRHAQVGAEAVHEALTRELTRDRPETVH